MNRMLFAYSYGLAGQWSTVSDPASRFAYGYDLDGNLTEDGRWTYTWDGENRLVRMVSRGGAPVRYVVFGYDWQGRRISKKVWNNTDGSGTAVVNERYLYDGWNLVAVLDGGSATLLKSFVWGTDLSGTLQGAGGVGGLLKVRQHSPSAANAYVAYDGNGNVVGLVNTADGKFSARYEYGPFGEVIRATGPMAKANPFRFSTKYQDEETGLLYYGYRYYDPSTGRWLSRDPIGEKGGLNLYGFIENDCQSGIDALGRFGIMPPGVRLGPRCKKEVSLHIGFVQGLFDATWYADGFGKGTADISVSVEMGGDILDLRETLRKRLGPEECIKTIFITAHGVGGNFGVISENPHDQVTLDSLKNPLSHQSEFFNFLAGRMCRNTECCVALAACNQASGEIPGQELMKTLSRLLNANVIGYDDTYAVWGWGDEYTACPDGSIKKTGSGARYDGSWMQWIVNHGDWKRWHEQKKKGRVTPPPQWK